MEEVIRLLKENPYGAFATVNDGKPCVRPWGFMFEEGGKLYFATANTKEVFQQLQKCPYAAFTSTSKDFVTVRVSGEVTFTKDIAYKQKALDSNEQVKGLYGTADNPTFEVFYIEHGEASISDFSGQPPKKFTF